MQTFWSKIFHRNFAARVFITEILQPKFITKNFPDPLYFKDYPNTKTLLTNESFFFWSYNIPTFFGGFFNLVLLYLIAFRTPGYLKPYARMLLLCCCADTYYLLTHAICHMVRIFGLIVKASNRSCLLKFFCWRAKLNKFLYKQHIASCRSNLQF
jgi:hypothetical protein